MALLDSAKEDSINNFEIDLPQNARHNPINNSELDRLASKNQALNTGYQTKWAVEVMKGTNFNLLSLEMTQNMTFKVKFGNVNKWGILPPDANCSPSAGRFQWRVCLRLQGREDRQIIYQKKAYEKVERF